MMRFFIGCGALLALAACGDTATQSEKILADSSSGRDWPAYGRTYGEQHFSPLTQISATNVKRLGLAWSLDLPPGNTITQPLAIDGMLYFTVGNSRIHAVDAASGKLLWVYDPKANEAAGKRLRSSWGSRGIAWWNDKIFTGAVDGRLIAVDAKTGRELWSQQTLQPGDLRYITGAPRVFDGKVIVGHGGADSADIRGYVTTYDADTGKFLWRFYTVPGDPAKGFEDDAQKMAAQTWSGEWWKYGGGGNVWNAMTYDAETDTILLGTGNGAPWNHRVRSAGKGDNLFLCSIVALDAKTGHYKWHYQINPGESWDYNASMDMHLADLSIQGKPRKVIVTAPKNGFLYVIDRLNGKLISAEKIAKVTWADRIDVKTGRPVETADARFPDGKTFELWPSPMGAHTNLPSAFSPKSGLVYIAVGEQGIRLNDRNIDPAKWKRKADGVTDFALNAGYGEPPMIMPATSALVAWNPISQKLAWKVPTPLFWNGGAMATAGDLVFQGQADGLFSAYKADTGERLWSMQAHGAVLAAPISYSVGGRQYVTVLTGMGLTAGINAFGLPRRFDYRTQERRVLTF
ncbi:MAG: PQQ-dependent dehydrogenase, methanol/ethanol family, partial [Caulobacterales bacterium]